MNALRPLIREFKLALYQWARHDMQRRNPMHEDLPEVVRRIHELTAERPPIEKKPRSRCAGMPGMCARDPNCEDRNCPGLYQRDGGMQVHGPLSFPIEHS